MTITEMHISLKLLVDKLDASLTPNIDAEVIDVFLNKAQDRFVKQRMSGLNVHRTSFEENQKRTDDLRALITDTVLTPEDVSARNKPFGRFFTLPSTSGLEYWFTINEEAEVVYQDCNAVEVESGDLEVGISYLVDGTITYNGTEYTSSSTTLSYFTAVSGVLTFTGTGSVLKASSKRVEVKPLSHDNYNKAVKDPFNKSYHNQVRRLAYQDQAELLGDETFAPSAYYLRYIKKPAAMSLDPASNCELSDHTHDEIVDIAVSLLLEDIESGRYQTNLNELIKQE